jgi:hypothetical protein
MGLHRTSPGLVDVRTAAQIVCAKDFLRALDGALAVEQVTETRAAATEPQRSEQSVDGHRNMRKPRLGAECVSPGRKPWVKLNFEPVPEGRQRFPRTHLKG